jgi:hypothetical protein
MSSGGRAASGVVAQRPTRFQIDRSLQTAAVVCRASGSSLDFGFDSVTSTAGNPLKLSGAI